MNKYTWQIKNNIRNNLYNKIRLKKIIRPKFCSFCGSISKIEAHHINYDIPNYIVWLCKKCHMNRHRKVYQLSLNFK